MSEYPDSSESPTPGLSAPERRGRGLTFWIGGAVALLLLAGAVFGVVFGLKYLDELDTVTKSYATLAEAEKELEPYQLPPILPPSAHDISVKWATEENDVVGTFRFDPKEINYCLTSGAEPIEPVGQAREISPGVAPATEHFLKFTDAGTDWLIVITDEGEGGYRSDF